MRFLELLAKLMICRKFCRRIIIDIEEGKNAGCRLSIVITTGACTLQQLQSAKPDYVINNLLELLPLLDR